MHLLALLLLILKGSLGASEFFSIKMALLESWISVGEWQMACEEVEEMSQSGHYRTEELLYAKAWLDHCRGNQEEAIALFRQLWRKELHTQAWLIAYDEVRALGGLTSFEALLMLYQKSQAWEAIIDLLQDLYEQHWFWKSFGLFASEKRRAYWTIGIEALQYLNAEALSESLLGGPCRTEEEVALLRSLQANPVSSAVLKRDEREASGLKCQFS